MTNEKRFEKLCEAIDKAAFKWGDGLTNSDVINACLVIASYFFNDVHRDKPCAEKCFGVCSQTFRKLCGLEDKTRRRRLAYTKNDFDDDQLH